MATMPATPLWYASGLRWIAGGLEGLADRLETTFASHTPSSSHDIHFDSDVYLAEVRNQVLSKHFY